MMPLVYQPESIQAAHNRAARVCHVSEPEHNVKPNSDRFRIIECLPTDKTMAAKPSWIAQQVNLHIKYVRTTVSQLFLQGRIKRVGTEKNYRYYSDGS